MSTIKVVNILSSLKALKGIAPETCILTSNNGHIYADALSPNKTEHISIKLGEGDIETLCVNCTTLFNVLENMDEAEISAQSEKIVIREGSTKATLKVSHAPPKLPDMEFSEPQTIPNDLLLLIYKAAKFALTEKGHRLNCLSIKGSDVKTEVVASDGTDIFVGRINHEPFTTPLSGVIPIKNIKAIETLAKIIEGPVSFQITSKGEHIRFTVGDATYTFITTMFSALQPEKTLSRIGDSFGTICHIKVKPLIQAMKAIKAVGGSNHATTLKISNDTIMFSVNNEKCDIERSIPVDVEGDPLTLHLNYHTLSMFFDATEEEFLTLNIVNEKTPILITGDDEWDGVLPPMVFGGV